MVNIGEEPQRQGSPYRHIGVVFSKVKQANNFGIMVFIFTHRLEVFSVDTPTLSPRGYWLTNHLRECEVCTTFH